MKRRKVKGLEEKERKVNGPVFVLNPEYIYGRQNQIQDD